MKNMTTAYQPTKTAWSGDVVGRGFEHLPVLGPAEQLERWRIWQGGLLAKNSPGEKNRAERVAAGERALEELVGANFRLAKAEASKAARKYGKGQRPSEILDDYLSVSYIGMLKAFGEFKPEGSLSLASKVAFEVRSHLREFGLAGMPANWHRVVTSAKRAEEELARRLGRTPTDQEVKDEVLRYSMQWAAEHLDAEDRAAGDTEAAAKSKLKRQGMWSAIENLDEIRANTQGMLSLNAPAGDEGGTLMDLIGDGSREEGLNVVQWFLSTLSETDRDLVVRRFGLTGDNGATFEELAEARSVPWTEVRSHLSDLLSRFSAPHAHFVFADPEFESRVDVEEPTSAASRLKSRRSQARASAARL